MSESKAKQTLAEFEQEKWCASGFAMTNRGFGIWHRGSLKWAQLLCKWSLAREDLLGWLAGFSSHKKQFHTMCSTELLDNSSI